MACSRVIIINKGKIVADGSPEELEKEGRRNAIIKIEVQNNTSDFLEKLKSWSGVIGVKYEGNHIEIEVQKDDDISVEVSEIVDVEVRTQAEIARVVDIEIYTGEDIRTEVARVAVESGAGLLGLEKKQTSLEDVFINLTNNGNE